jgi:hypothetical protein
VYFTPEVEESSTEKNILKTALRNTEKTEGRNSENYCLDHSGYYLIS